MNSNNQHISHTHNYLPAQLPPPLPPLRRCPLPSQRFTGRKDELTRIASFFFRAEVSKHVFLLIGMGGCGKSQLAFYLFHEEVLRSGRFHPSMVFFIDATTAATLEEGYTAIALAKGIGNSSQSALDWLSNVNVPFFLLIDNADNPSINLRDYLPRTINGSILITTRLHDSGYKYGSGEGSFIELQALQEADAEHLLMTTAGLREQERPEASILVKELHCYALAVVQAGAGIRVLHLPVSEYIALFRQHRTSLMNGTKDRVTAGDLDDYHWTVRTAYQISTRQIPVGSAALLILELLGHLHHSGITEELFQRAFRALESYEPAVPLSTEEESALQLLRKLLANFSAPDASWDSLSFRGCMGELMSSSLISRDDMGRYLIHPLLRDGLKEDFPKSLPAAFLLTLNQAIDDKDNTYIHNLLSHAERVLSSVDETNLHPDLARALGRICVYQEKGLRSEALLRVSIARCDQELGKHSAPGLRCLASLSTVYSLGGRYRDAHEIRKQLFRISDSEVGPDHPDTIRAMAGMAETSSKLGLYNEVEEIERHILSKRVKTQGPDHRDTLHSIADLAGTLGVLGRYEEAEQIGRLVLEKQTSILGPDHPDTLFAMACLAVTLRYLSRYEEAEVLQREVFEKRRVHLGSNHLEILHAMKNLSSTLSLLHRYEDAEQMGRQVLERRMAALGPDHPDTISAMGVMARILRSLTRYEEAEQMIRQVLEKRVALFGAGHPDTIQAMANLASTLRDLGRHEETEQLRKKILEERMSSLGPDHSKTIAALGNLASTLRQLGRYEEAESMERQVLERRRSIFGADHPDTVCATANLAGTLQYLGRYEESEQLRRHVLQKKQSILGPDHPETLTAMRNLAFTLRCLHLYEEAERMERHILLTRTYQLGPDHPKTIAAMDLLASTVSIHGHCLPLPPPVRASLTNVELAGGCAGLSSTQHPSRTRRALPIRLLRRLW